MFYTHCLVLVENYHVILRIKNPHTPEKALPLSNKAPATEKDVKNYAPPPPTPGLIHRIW